MSEQPKVAPPLAGASLQQVWKYLAEYDLDLARHRAMTRSWRQRRHDNFGPKFLKLYEAARKQARGLA